MLGYGVAIEERRVQRRGHAHLGPRAPVDREAGGLGLIAPKHGIEILDEFTADDRSAGWQQRELLTMIGLVGAASSGAAEQARPHPNRLRTRSPTHPLTPGNIAVFASCVQLKVLRLQQCYGLEGKLVGESVRAALGVAPGQHHTTQ